MSTLSTRIFHSGKHVLTSPYGRRSIISTSKGSTSSFHSGADYGTYGVKLPQYAIADGKIISCGTDWAYGGAKYVWVQYPALGVKMLHYHLDSYKVKKGQAVDKNTVLGYTGKTGKATGIHLHLGVKKLSGGGYVDPEKWSSEALDKPVKRYEKGSYRVTASLLNVRAGAGTKYRALKFSQLTSSAQRKILRLCGQKKNGYVKGLTFDVLDVNGDWGKTPSGWVCLDYCERI